MKIYKLVVLGSAGVGKSALTIQFVENIFVSNYDPTIEDCYQKHLDDYILEIYDTAGVDHFAVSRDSLIRSGDGFLLVYSIASLASFNEVSDIRDQILRQKNDVPIILIGNKSDLENERKVDTENGASLASQFACPFIETSAKERTNVENAFYHLTNQIIEKEIEDIRRRQQEQLQQQNFYSSSRSVSSNATTATIRRRRRDRFRERCNFV